MDAPSTTAVEVAGLPTGTRLTVLGGREEREGVVWWRVQVVETGVTGFVEEQFLTVAGEALEPRRGAGSIFFAAAGFTEEFRRLAAERGDVRLVGLDELYRQASL